MNASKAVETVENKLEGMIITEISVSHEATISAADSLNGHNPVPAGRYRIVEVSMYVPVE